MTTLVKTQFNSTTVFFTEDAFLNATAIAKDFKKQPRDYLKSQQTKDYLSALAQSLTVKTNVLTKPNQLVTVKRGGKDQGTWLHPKLAIHFARWLSAEFAVWCDEQIERILKRQKTTKEDRTPLKNAVTAFVSASSHHNYSQAYTLVHEAFNVESIEDIPLAQLSQAVEYVYGLIFKLEDCEPTKLSKKDIFQKSHSEVCAYLKAMTDEIKRLGGKLPSQPKIDTEAVANAYIHQHIAFNRMTLTLDEKGEAKVRLMPRDHRIIADSSLAKIISDPFGIDKKYLADIAQAASARLGKLIGK